MAIDTKEWRVVEYAEMIKFATGKTVAKSYYGNADWEVVEFTDGTAVQSRLGYEGDLSDVTPGRGAYLECQILS